MVSSRTPTTTSPARESGVFAVFGPGESRQDAPSSPSLPINVSSSVNNDTGRATTMTSSTSILSGTVNHPASALPTRTYRACLPCRARKTRCDLGDPNDPDEPPCARCRREGRGKDGCVFVESRRGGRGNIEKGRAAAAAATLSGGEPAASKRRRPETGGENSDRARGGRRRRSEDYTGSEIDRHDDDVDDGARQSRRQESAGRRTRRSLSRDVNAIGNDSSVSGDGIGSIARNHSSDVVDASHLDHHPSTDHRVAGRRLGVDDAAHRHANPEGQLSRRRSTLNGHGREEHAEGDGHGGAADASNVRNMRRAVTSATAAHSLSTSTLGIPHPRSSTWFPSMPVEINPLRPGQHYHHHQLVPTAEAAANYPSWSSLSMMSTTASTANRVPATRDSHHDDLGVGIGTGRGGERMATGLFGLNGGGGGVRHHDHRQDHHSESGLQPSDASAVVRDQILDLAGISASSSSAISAGQHEHSVEHDETVITPSSLPSVSAASAAHARASPASAMMQHASNGGGGEHHLDVIGPASKRRRLSSRRGTTSGVGGSASTAPQASSADPRLIVMSEMHNESDALSILAKAATGGRDPGWNKGRDGEGDRRHSDSSRSDGDQSDTGSDVAEQENAEVSRIGQARSDRLRSGGNGRGAAQEAVHGRCSTNDNQGERGNDAHSSDIGAVDVAGRYDLNISSQDAPNARGPSGTHTAAQPSRIHYASSTLRQRHRLDHFPLVEQDLLDVDHLLQLVRSFFELQHPIFPLLSGSHIPRTDEEIATFASDEVELTTVIVIVASRWETSRTYRRIHRQSWELFRVSRPGICQLLLR